eukprot:6102408-Pleurochrysis_carterae.AAC.1
MLGKRAKAHDAGGAVASRVAMRVSLDIGSPGGVNGGSVGRLCLQRGFAHERLLVGAARLERRAERRERR